MKLKHLPYYLFIILFSCMEPTLVPDCSGVIGGEAVADVCGVCGGIGKTGCDSTCGSTLQIDCAGVCGGPTKTDCNGDCGGNSFTDYFCKENENGTPNLDSLSLECFGVDENGGNCSPNTDSCHYIDCGENPMYNDTVIDCNWNLPTCDTTYTIEDEIDKIECDKYDSSDWLSDGSCHFEFTNCEEFEFDGGDCNLIDCSGLHFSDELCVLIFGQVCTETEGDNSALGDGFCDDGNDDVLPVNFNCEKWGFDGAECICEDENNSEYDCWVKTSAGNYDCPSEGEVRGGDCR